MKKTKHLKRNLDDIELLPEEPMEDIELDDLEIGHESIEDEPETTEEITEEDFYRFKDSLPEGNDWET